MRGDLNSVEDIMEHSTSEGMCIIHQALLELVQAGCMEAEKALEVSLKSQ